MTHPPFLREKARELRVSKHLTIDELAKQLVVSRTTAYYWVRDLPIPASRRAVAARDAARRRGTRSMQARYRRLRERAYAHGMEIFPMLIRDPMFRDFLCLYIAEGYKRSRNRVSLINSDPAVIILGNRWIRRLARNRILYAIQYHQDQDLNSLTAFWAGELDIDPATIRLQRKSNSNGLSGRTWRSRYGVLTVSCNDTAFRARLQAWMDCLRASWA